MKIIEAVPNFSLGRNQRDFLALKKILSKGSVRLLDYSRDVDHNRTVATLVGTPGSLKKIILEAVAAVIELVDISCHSGVHPCLGSTDVVPFVPLKNAVMADCVRLAAETGGELARRFRLPVYLYGQAASRPERKNLAQVRKGGLKFLAQNIATPEGAPDFGPARIHHRAGAVIIGARDFLIAFNVNFASSDLEAVRKIARKIREKDGGLAGIKALGFYLESRKCTQLSINICDFRKTGLTALMTEIRRQAKIYNLEIKNSEIIGLVPAAALEGVTPEFLALSGAGQRGHGFYDCFERLLFKWR